MKSLDVLVVLWLLLGLGVVSGRAMQRFRD